MQTITYLKESFNKGKLTRWDEKVMPLPVYIAKFNWYRSQGANDEYKYTNMVIDALNTWEKLSCGLVSFERVLDLRDSLVNIEWRRVNRQSLGMCTFNFNKNGGFFSADVSIGLSDGLLYRKYMDENEVYHTILHEIGHALGLGHSDSKNDIMYTPHQFGIVNISQNDLETLKWLYKFPYGKTESEILAQYSNFGASDIDDLVLKMKKQGVKSDFEKTKDAILAQNGGKNLLDENQNIGDLKKYLMEINNIKINFKPKR